MNDSQRAEPACELSIRDTLGSSLRARTNFHEVQENLSGRQRATGWPENAPRTTTVRKHVRFMPGLNTASEGETCADKLHNAAYSSISFVRMC
jgi:hypothetical protein